MSDLNTSNDLIKIDAEEVSLEELINTYKDYKDLEEKSSKALGKRDAEKALKPYQAELIKLQNHLEETQQKMIILFEGRDAAGKGGTI